MRCYFFVKKNLLLLIIIIFILLFTTGCWNRKELSQLGIVGSAAIDAQEGGVKLTYEVITPKRIDNKSADEKAVSYFQSEGKSIFDAVRNATLKFDKKLFWSHANVFFFNEKSADKSLLKYLDLFNRDHEFRRYANLIITKGMPAYEIMGINGTNVEVPSSFIETLFENNIVNGKGVSIKIIDFLKAYYAEGIEPVVGVIQIVKRNETELKILGNKKEEYMPSVEGAAVFREDKLVGFLDGFQTRGFNFITDKIKSGLIVSASPDRQGINSVEIIRASGKMDVGIDHGKYYGIIKIKINGMIGEETGEENISSIKVISEIEDDTSNIIKQEIEDCIKKAQEYNTDIFGFGQTIHRKYPVDWEKIEIIGMKNFLQ